MVISKIHYRAQRGRRLPFPAMRGRIRRLCTHHTGRLEKLEYLVQNKECRKKKAQHIQSYVSIFQFGDNAVMSQKRQFFMEAYIQEKGNEKDYTKDR